MMPHEYEREIKLLKENMGAVNQLLRVIAKQLDASEALHDARSRVMNITLEKLKLIEDKLHGQADKQDKERPEEGRKGHKKAVKDGQEAR